MPAAPGSVLMPEPPALLIRHGPATASNLHWRAHFSLSPPPLRRGVLGASTRQAHRGASLRAYAVFGRCLTATLS